MSRYLMCPECGHRLRRVYSSNGYWDGETYTCDFCNAMENDENSYDEESISLSDAADIWASNGKDEDYTFGYSEDELEEALNN